MDTAKQLPRKCVKGAEAGKNSGTEEVGREEHEKKRKSFTTTPSLMQRCKFSWKLAHFT